jgi:hypothetical protein
MLPVMDPLLAVNRLPQLAQAAMRSAVLGAALGRRTTPRALIDDALVRFEGAVQGEATDGIRPTLLFSERDRIVRELRTFITSRLAVRLGHLDKREFVALGRAAAPFDAVVRNRAGEVYAVVLRRLPSDGRRLERLRRIGLLAAQWTKSPLRGVLVYDFSTGRTRLVSGDPAAYGVDRNLRAS